MKRQVKWSVRRDLHGRVVRSSRCGRFVIRTKHMASARNGCWTARAYAAERVDGTRIGRLHDTLSDALDAVELKNDPNWEPDE